MVTHFRFLFENVHAYFNKMFDYVSPCNKEKKKKNYVNTHAFVMSLCFYGTRILCVFYITKACVGNPKDYAILFHVANDAGQCSLNVLI